MVGANQSLETSITSSPTKKTAEATMENIPTMSQTIFNEKLHLLMYKEKVSRNEKDFETHQKVLDKILALCRSHEQWKSLGECLMVIVKKKSYIQSSTRAFIQNIMKILDKIADKEARCSLMHKLRSVCDGKLFLEREHTEVTKMLASLYEGDGKIAQAAEFLGEVKIEAYGSLTPREKAEFILQEMRLLIKSEQNEKAAILSKKIQVKFLNDPENEDLKIKYYDMKIELERWTSYLETSRFYRILSSCESLSADLRSKMIINSSIFCVLAPKSQEQLMFTEELLHDANAKKEPTICELLQFLSSKELISGAAFKESFQTALNKTKLFEATSRFGRKCLADLEQRIIEHNILIIAKYYSRIPLTRMAELTHTSVPDCEQNVARMVNSGLMTARIDRYTGVVDFSTICIRECVLNEWFETVSQVMSYTNLASHQVQKEFMLTAAVGSGSDESF